MALLQMNTSCFFQGSLAAKEYKGDAQNADKNARNAVAVRVPIVFRSAPFSDPQTVFLPGKMLSRDGFSPERVREKAYVTALRRCIHHQSGFDKATPQPRPFSS
jgi:hypothetical protein